MRFKTLLGGAITGDVRTMDVETKPLPGFDDILKKAQMLQGSPQMTEYLHGVADLNFTNDIAMFQYQPAFEAESEVVLHRDLHNMTTGRGLKHDHPLVGKTIMESIKHYPKLQHLYANA